jgi:hypothetical protein
MYVFRITYLIQFANQTLNNLTLKINPATVINKKTNDKILYPNLTNQYFTLVKKAIFLSDLKGMFTKALSRIKNNTLHIKPAKLGIRYTSATKYPISNKEELNKPRKINPRMITTGLNHRSLEEINESVSSIMIGFNVILFSYNA